MCLPFSKKNNQHSLLLHTSSILPRSSSRVLQLRQMPQFETIAAIEAIAAYAAVVAVRCALLGEGTSWGTFSTFSQKTFCFLFHCSSPPLPPLAPTFVQHSTLPWRLS